MGKKKSRRKKKLFKQNNSITYNKYNPNRQARRMGIVAEKPPEEEKQAVRRNVAAVLTEKAKEARETQRRIVPQGMTYKQYMELLREKQKQMEERKGGQR